MKKLIKALLIFIFIINISSSYGEDSSDINFINKITYNGYLEKNTDVLIELKNPNDNCKLVSVSNEKINFEIDDKTGYIRFNLSELGDKFKKGNILVNCNNKLSLKEFNFPYISDYKIHLDENNNINKNTIQIFGENFGDRPRLFIGENELKITEKNDRYIIAKLNEEINENELYIESNGNKSNKIVLNIQSPIIYYIKSDNGFRKGTELEVFYDNFEFGDNLLLVIELDNKQDKINLLKKHFTKKGSFKIKLDDKYLGKIKIFLIKNSLKSNEIELNISGNIPIIEQVLQGIDKDGNKILKINGKNFIDNNTQAFINGKKAENLKVLNYEQIIIDEDGLIKKGNNYIYITFGTDRNKQTSNFGFLYIPGDKEPFIGNITTEGLTPDNKYRIFRLTTNYFNKKTDDLLLNDRYVNDYGYYGSIIKAKIEKDITKGFFSFRRENEILNFTKYFDISYEKTPYINYIKIDGDLKPGTKVTIVGKNFFLAKISESNLLGKNNKQNIDAEISDSKIIGYLPQTFDKEKRSSITITNNGLTNSLVFNLGELNSKQINGKVIFKEIINKNCNYTFKQGDTLEIFGSYFHTNDNLFLNNEKISFKYINPNQIEVILPEDLESGIYNFKIVNNIGIETNLTKFYVYDKKQNPKIKIIELKNNNTEIIVNPVNQKTDNSLVLNYEVTNKINDILIKNITFKTENYKDNRDMLGRFKLYLNDNLVGKTIINEKGEIIFSKPFILEKDLERKQSLTLRKTSPFIKEGEFKLKLDKIKAVFQIKGTEKEVKDFEINNLNTNFKVIFSQNEILDCIDNKNKLIKCSEFKLYEDKEIKETTENEEIKIKKEENTYLINTDKIKYVKQLANSRHKLQKSLKGQKYIKLIDKLTIKYSKNLDNLLKLDKKIKVLQEKLKNKNGLKYQETKNVINYLDAKISLEIMKQTK